MDIDQQVLNTVARLNEGGDYFRETVSIRRIGDELPEHSRKAVKASLARLVEASSLRVDRPHLALDYALEALTSRMDEIADCDALNSAAFDFEMDGGRPRIAKLGGALALAAFDAGMAQLAAHDAAGLLLVQGMIKIASKKRLPKAQAQIVTCPWNKKSAGVTIIPGFSISLTDGPTYFIGGRAEYDSYNLHYFGTITSITAKTVTVAPRSGAKKRLKIIDFVARNDVEISVKVARNVETSYSI